MPTTRRPQINFQVDPPMKLLYEEARMWGHWVTRFCAAGLLLMVEDARIRARALNRLREWEVQYEGASPEDIRAFVQGTETALQRGTPGGRKAPKARPGPKKPKRGRSG